MYTSIHTQTGIYKLASVNSVSVEACTAMTERGVPHDPELFMSDAVELAVALPLTCVRSMNVKLNMKAGRVQEVIVRLWRSNKEWHRPVLSRC
jgi:hypothetical protein